MWSVPAALVAEAAAQEAKSDGAAVKVIKDVSYGPRGVRNVMDFYLPEAGANPRPLVICIHGGGWAGAHLASYVALAETRDNSDPELAQFSSRVQCVVDCYGPVELVGMMRSASGPIVQGFVGKPLEGHEEDYQKASAVSYVEKNPPPFLIVHGTRDVGTSPGQVPIEQSIEFFSKHLAKKVERSSPAEPQK